jgi:hypothetical protein
MATKIGPKTVTQRDRSKNLVFCVDAANSRSYGGEPTTNLAPPDLADWDDSGTSVRTAAGYTFQGQPVYKCRTQVGSVWIGIDKTISGLRTAASGSTVCMSIWVKNPNPSSYTFSAYIGHDFSSNRTLAANSGWQKIEWTVAVGSMANDYVEYRPYTNSADIYIHMTMPQVEVKAVSTPFTTSSRSATTALKNISGVGAQGTSLEATTFETYGQQLYKPTARNVLASFDKNQGHIGGAYWDLDGTDEYINCGNDSTLNFGTGDFTIGFWVNMTGWVGNWAWPVSKNSGYTGMFIALTSPGYFRASLGAWFTDVIGSYSSEPTISFGTWYHFTLTRASGSVTAYLNGDTYGTSVANSYDLGTQSAQSLNIGLGPSASNFTNGRVASVMAWNAGLTAKEVKDIYIAQKGRFGK